MASFLNRFTRCCWLGYRGMQQPLPATPRQWIVTDSARVLADGNVGQALGIALVDVGVDVQWCNILCDVQMASSAELLPEAIERLSTGASNIFATQEDRLFHIGLAIAGDTFQLASFDRAGRVLSGRYDVQEHAFIFAPLGMTVLDKSFGGKDTSIVTRGGLRFVSVGGVEYEILQTLSICKNICGRGTICWRCRRPGSDEDFVIKNVWANQRRHGFDTEGDLLRMARNHDGVARLVCEETVLQSDGRVTTTMSLHEGLMRLGGIGGLPQLELRRLVLQPYARPLGEFSSKDELLQSLRDGIAAHSYLYNVCDVLHCDISDNNVMIHAKTRRGLLIDLDCAVKVEGYRWPKLATKRSGMGTLPFVACDMLNTFSEPQAPWHDLESFLHVLMYMCASYSGPSNTPREDFDIFDSPMDAWMTGDARRKARVMYTFDDNEFRGFVDSVFDPYFDDLKDLVYDLRTALFRLRDSEGKRDKPDHDMILEIFDRHIEARRAALDRAATIEHARSMSSADTQASGERRNEKPSACYASAASNDGTIVIPSPPRPRKQTWSSGSQTSDGSERTLVPSRHPSEETEESKQALKVSLPRKRKRTADEEQTSRSSKRRKVY
ncbi:hypothetical protein BD626DRAFT_435258 [Schizophyllum amplum]|uniref:Protein kinase domain-containing protein n=1 Tax=Schizophyllum amplum TaxID=97359 RepID=A0A550C7R8_9AGAR|nr:hypothetical protein BD626DRAFT_435258 [Auriculariopsis ampla]